MEIRLTLPAMVPDRVMVLAISARVRKAVIKPPSKKMAHSSCMAP